MSQYTAPLRDMQFVLHELLHVEDELKNLPPYAEIDADIINQVLEEGSKFATQVVFPLNHSLRLCASVANPAISFLPLRCRRLPSARFRGSTCPHFGLGSWCRVPS